MLTLYEALLGQHARQLKPLRCARSTIAQLHRYFEDVVLENNLNALVIENLPSLGKQLNREKARVRELAGGSRRAFFLVTEAEDFKDVITAATAQVTTTDNVVQLEPAAGIAAGRRMPLLPSIAT